MNLTVDTSLPASIVIGATGLVGLAQEIRTVIATRKGSVPLDRDFGISWDAVDAPVSESKSLLVAELVTQIEKYVPRVTVESVAFKPDADGARDGAMYPVVTVNIREEYLHDFS